MAETPADLRAEIEKYERKHAENPTGRYFVPLANAYRKLGELEMAEDLLRAGLRHHPDYLSARIVLGRVLADRGAHREAAAEFRHVLAVDPQNLIALKTLGELALADGERDQAASWYRELLAVDPMNDEARQALDDLAAPLEEPADEEFHGGGWWSAVEPTAEAAPLPPIELEPREPVPFSPDRANDGDEGERLGLDGWEPTSAATPSPDERDLVLDELLDWGAAPTDTGAAEPAEPGFDPEPEVATETLAELYARQGFHDRAAEVYRELLRRQDDPRLRERLAEAERAAAGEPLVLAAAAPELMAPAGAAEGDGDPFAASFVLGFDDSADIAGDQPGETPALPAPEDAAAEAPDEPPAASRTIRRELAELLAWRPGAAAEPAAGVQPQPAAPAAEVDAGVASEVELEVDAEPEPTAAAEVSAGLEPVQTAPEPHAAGAPADEEPLFPWETEAAEPAPASAEQTPAGFSLDDLFPEPAPAAAPPSAPAPNAAAAPAEDDDEDLESFQAWLRSLKR